MYNKTKTINLSVSGTALPVAPAATFEQQQQIVGCVSCMREEEREREREGWRVRQDEREAMKEAL